MSMDHEFLELVRTADAVTLAGMLAEEHAEFHAVAGDHYAAHAWLSCCIYAQGGLRAERADIEAQARAVQALRHIMDVIEERVGLIRATLHREVVRT